MIAFSPIDAPARTIAPAQTGDPGGDDGRARVASRCPGVRGKPRLAADHSVLADDRTVTHDAVPEDHRASLDPHALSENGPLHDDGAFAERQ